LDVGQRCGDSPGGLKHSEHCIYSLKSPSQKSLNCSAIAVVSALMLNCICARFVTASINAILPSMYS
jgi:hypothetical protein